MARRPPCRRGSACAPEASAIATADESRCRCRAALGSFPFGRRLSARKTTIVMLATPMPAASPRVRATPCGSASPSGGRPHGIGLAQASDAHELDFLSIVAEPDGPAMLRLCVATAAPRLKAHEKAERHAEPTRDNGVGDSGPALGRLPPSRRRPLEAALRNADIRTTCEYRPGERWPTSASQKEPAPLRRRGPGACPANAASRGFARLTQVDYPAGVLVCLIAHDVTFAANGEPLSGCVLRRGALTRSGWLDRRRLRNGSGG
jgi:hypothetical protein